MKISEHPALAEYHINELEKQIEVYVKALYAADAILHLLPDISTDNFGKTMDMTTRKAERMVNAALHTYETR